MDDALTVSRSQTEESQAARMIYNTTGLYTQFIKYVDTPHIVHSVMLHTISMIWLNKVNLTNYYYLSFICVFSLLYVRGLDSLSGKNKSSGPVSLPLDGVILSLQDLIHYFRPPEEELEHEEKQTKLRSLRNRQNLFQEEVCLCLFESQTIRPYPCLHYICFVL